jgi:hypothetical protein
MFEYKDRLVTHSRHALAPEFFEVPLEPSVPIREVHAALAAVVSLTRLPTLPDQLGPLP